MSKPISNNNYSPWGEGLVCLLLLGLIGAVVLPSFLSPSHRIIRRPEAFDKISRMNREQKVHFIENNSYAKSLNDLQRNEELQRYFKSQKYHYSIQGLDNTAFQYGISLQPDLLKINTVKHWFVFTHTYPEYELPSYLGVVWEKPNPNADLDETQSDLQMFSILCESTYPYLLEEGFQPSSQNGDFHCPEGMKLVERLPENK